MKVFFLGGTRNGEQLEIDGEILSVSFSDSNKAAKYHMTEIVVSICGTSKSVDVMVAEDLPHMEAINRFMEI